MQKEKEKAANEECKKLERDIASSRTIRKALYHGQLRSLELVPSGEHLATTEGALQKPAVLIRHAFDPYRIWKILTIRLYLHFISGHENWHRQSEMRTRQITSDNGGG
ncbi:hypothetical protein M378DRAFT_164169 [Amanita muscaria Koide BX008]|uniref:Uncharacterized protein n=1 Tax=Amanita muscaria (strain Koide BX008) TaxID=946122 RepID=A0A0C2X3E2_AMAMK|nr:hypothetical protein M378DRAFT_164169 [Amanita muscaria Koide BX008]